MAGSALLTEIGFGGDPDEPDSVGQGQGKGQDGTACFGISAVLRMTFALFLTHFVILLMILPRNTCAAVIHDGGWCLKFFGTLALFIIFFWIPIDFF